MNYVFFTKAGREHSEFERSCRDDLTARKLAQSNPTVIKVETKSARVVYRKPMSEKELAAVLGIPVNGDLANWLDREK